MSKYDSFFDELLDKIGTVNNKIELLFKFVKPDGSIEMLNKEQMKDWVKKAEKAFE